MTKLVDICNIIRSKNSGPYELTIDIIFKSKEDFNMICEKKIINEEDWSYLGATEDNRITLITCVTGQKDKRLCVQAIESMDGMNYGQ